jgi:chromosome segregation ATPase
VSTAPESDLATLRAEVHAQKLSVEALDLRVEALGVRLDQRIAAERDARQAEIAALREEWRNLAQAISANSTALGNATKQILAEAAEIRSEQKHQSQQLRLIGQGMEILLRDEGST